MVHLSRAEFDATARAMRQAAATRKSKRAEKAAVLWPAKTKKARKATRTRISQVSDRGALKAAIVTLLGLLDCKLNGPYCRLGHLCPATRDIGMHAGQVGYHLTPQMRGDAARFLQDNVVWACHRANFGEVNNRDLYRQHHITIFGAARIERIEAISRETRKYSTAELIELRAAVKAKLEA